MSADDMSEFINEFKSGDGDIANRESDTSYNLMGTLERGIARTNAFLGDTLYDRTIAPITDRITHSDMFQEGVRISDIQIPNLGEVLSQTTFGSGSFTPIFDSMLFQERIEESKTRDGRGSGMRIIQEVMGGRGIQAAYDIQEGLINAIDQAGGNARGSTLIESVGMLKDLIGQRQSNGGAGILANVENVVQSIGNNMSEITHSDLESVSSSLSGFTNFNRDIDGDGDVDKTDLALAQAGNAVVQQMQLLHPLIAKAHRDPNFMVRQIKKKNISKEDSKNRGDQANLVQQGIAAYIEDVNMFNVKY